MFEREGGTRPSLVLTTVKAAAVIVGLCWFATNWISSTTDRQSLARLAASISRGEEPTTTGSIGQKAGATRIDPCVAPKR